MADENNCEFYHKSILQLQYAYVKENYFLFRLLHTSSTIYIKFLANKMGHSIFGYPVFTNEKSVTQGVPVLIQL